MPYIPPNTQTSANGGSADGPLSALFCYFSGSIYRWAFSFDASRKYGDPETKQPTFAWGEFLIPLLFNSNILFSPIINFTYVLLIILLLQQIWSAFFGTQQCLFIAPFFNFGMVTAHEHLRHQHSLKINRAGIHRRRQQIVLERIC